MSAFLLPKHIHIVGIGGIGLSSLAQLLRREGCEISGSDRESSEVTRMLEKQGISVAVGQRAENVPTDVQLLIYSDAVPMDNPERAVGRERGIPELSYFEALGNIANGNFLIVVSGTHGKTTTTAMLADILEEAGLEPTVVVGSIRSKTKTNFQAGGGNYFLVEGDEYRRHFLFFKPNLLVITNIDADHLDYYKDLADIQSAFRELVLRVPPGGYIITNPNHPHLAPVLEGASASIIDYTKIGQSFKLKFPGKHNILNAEAALSAASALGVSPEVGIKALENFAGTARRFEYKGTTPEGVLIYDDYAHNPQKVRAALSGAREQFPRQKVFVVFQPHLYSRTKLLLPEFAQSFNDADEVLILPIYAAREKDDGETSNHTLKAAMTLSHQKVQAFSFEEAIGYLHAHAKRGDVVVTMGAGEAFKVGDALLQS